MKCEMKSLELGTMMSCTFRPMESMVMRTAHTEILLCLSITYMRSSLPPTLSLSLKVLRKLCNEIFENRWLVPKEI